MISRYRNLYIVSRWDA